MNPNDNNILDDELIRIKDVQMTQKRIGRLFVVGGVLTLIAIILFILRLVYWDERGPSEPFNEEDLLMSVLLHLILIPLFSFLPTIIFNLIPFRGLTYKRRYINTYLVVLIIINLILCVGYIEPELFGLIEELLF